MNQKMLLPLAALATVAAVAAAGCGGTTTKTVVSTVTTTVTDSATDTGAPASGAPTEATGGAVTVTMSDFKFAPSNVSAAAGSLKVSAPNEGKTPHELVLIKSDRAAGSFPVKDGKVSEEGSVGEIGETEPGKTGTETFNLKPGKYVMICNIAGHYQAGMYGTVVVK